MNPIGAKTLRAYTCFVFLCIAVYFTTEWCGR